MHPAFRVRALAACLTASLAILSPLASSAAVDRSAEGSVIVLATQGSVHGIGVGTVIAKAGTRVRVLTAAHVATHGTLQLRLQDGTESPARLLVVVSGRDLALIEADVTAATAASLQAAPLAQPQAAQPLHVWGSGNDGPAYETATARNVGAAMPDGAPHGRYALGCALCHEGDSGAGIYNERGELVGVYIGYFDITSGRLSVAELPTADVAMAARRTLASPTASATSVVATANVSGAR